MSLFLPASNMRIASEVAQFCATFLLFPFRHPGLDPGSIHPTLREWIPDQVRDDDRLNSCAKTRIANEVRQFPEPFA
jgi:hypothetical protein